VASVKVLFLFETAVSEWEPGVLSLRVKRPGLEAVYTASNAEFMNAWSYATTPPHVFMACLFIKHRDSVTLSTVVNGKYESRREK
jgi:hypothetical protein